MTNQEVEQLLKGQAIEFEQHSAIERQELIRRWLETFSNEVKKQTGAWVYNNFMWHSFSVNFENSIQGVDALHTYKSQWLAPFAIFNEKGSWSYRCKSDAYPDFSALGQDIYVVHHKMKWTMVFTHEQPHDGPYFANAHR